MNVNDILRLVEAGFSKDDILSMVSEKEPAEGLKTAEIEEPVKTEMVKPEEPESVKAFAATVKDFQTAVNDLQKTIQRTNRLTASAPEEVPKSDVDILSDILGGKK